MEDYKQGYPRMQLRRKEWLNLNGTWGFEFDDNGVGLQEQWYKRSSFSKEINVPFAYETAFSGIHDPSKHDAVWYMTHFVLDEGFEGKNVLLHFGAVDYECRIYLNDEMVYTHRGGNVGFTVPIQNHRQGENKLVVYAHDPSGDETIPRGKQFWEEKSRRIWYTKTTGIWQTVWLEPVSDVYIMRLKMTPDVDTGLIHMEIALNKCPKQLHLSTEITLGNQPIQSVVHTVTEKDIQFSVDVFQKHIFSTSFYTKEGRCWTPENPVLFDVAFLLQSDQVEDVVQSYFGMRKIHTENGMIYLNNQRYYQKLVLDQGYWPDSGMTAPEDEALVKDIQDAKAMGFNGCRKHQKVEEERFLYWADKLGYLVWSEMPSGIYYDDNYVERLCTEWMAVIQRDYNHPAVVVWVPLNESWGIPNIRRSKTQMAHSLCMYYLTHSLDDTRLVISNDGWEMTQTDLCTVHNYNHGNPDQVEQHHSFQACLKNREAILYERPTGRPIFVEGFESQQVPVILSEFGGISFVCGDEKSWGYTHVNNAEVFLSEYRRLITAIQASEVLDGFCYTQFTDVESEVNGLLTADRKAKVCFEKIKEINDRCDGKTIKE